MHAPSLASRIHEAALTWVAGFIATCCLIELLPLLPSDLAGVVYVGLRFAFVPLLAALGLLLGVVAASVGLARHTRAEAATGALLIAATAAYLWFTLNWPGPILAAVVYGTG